MKTVYQMRFMTSSRRCVAVMAWLTLAGASTALAQKTASSVLDQLQAAEAAANQMVQNPPSVPVNWRHAKDLDEASRRFAAWQQDMFQQRQEIAKKPAKLLHDRMKVPPPLPPSEPDAEPPMTRLDLPLAFFPANVNLRLSIGEPTVSLAVGAEAGALSCVGASYKVEAAYAARIGSVSSHVQKLLTAGQKSNSSKR
jgi:hypothetical protein